MTITIHGRYRHEDISGRSGGISTSSLARTGDDGLSGTTEHTRLRWIYEYQYIVQSFGNGVELEGTKWSSMICSRTWIMAREMVRPYITI